MSAWPVMVGRPVDGPVRWTLTITQGVSVHTARPRFSIIRLKPGPEVAVMDLAPVQAAPRIEAMAAISSSICRKVPPTSGSRSAMCSAISVAGVIG